jgi:hypothetical protein
MGHEGRERESFWGEAIGHEGRERERAFGGRQWAMKEERERAFGGRQWDMKEERERACVCRVSLCSIRPGTHKNRPNFTRAACHQTQKLRRPTPRTCMEGGGSRHWPRTLKNNRMWPGVLRTILISCDRSACVRRIRLIREKLEVV